MQEKNSVLTKGVQDSLTSFISQICRML